MERKHYLMALGAIALLTVQVTAQSAPDARNLNGMWVWQEPSNDITRNILPGEEISFTPYGAERYRTLDHTTDRSNTCKSVGYFRAMQTPLLPYQIVQTAAVTAIVMEYHYNFRLIYTDGRDHPADIYDYPELMGHSIGRWEGDTLIVDTLGFSEGTWLDTNGFEHSDQLRVTERFRKTGPDTMRWEVTIEDRVFFMKPFTYAGNLLRDDEGRIMSYDCGENEQDSAHMLPTPTGGRHANRQVLKFPE